MAKKPNPVASLLGRLLRQPQQVEPNQAPESAPEQASDPAVPEVSEALGQAPALAPNGLSGENPPEGSALLLDGVALVFGVQWSPISGNAPLRKQLTVARQKKYPYFALAPEKAAVGLIGAFPGSMGRKVKKYSASLVLSEFFSTSGAELFVFEHAGQCALVGLSENNPLPGFDAIGTRLEIQALAQEFMEMNSERQIRYIGNVDWLDDINPMPPVQMVERVNSRAQLSAMPNPTLRLSILALALLVGGGLWGASTYLENAWAEKQSQNHPPPPDPNIGYELAIVADLAKVGEAGNPTLNAWRKAISEVPIESGGWVLHGFECKPQECTGKWRSESSSFEDFEAAFPYPSSKRPAMVPTENGERMLQTTHPVPTPVKNAAADSAPASKLTRQMLPKARDAHLQWASFIQDFNLIPGQKGIIKAAVFYGGSSIEKIKNPVFKGTWSLDSQLWTLPDIFLPGYVVPESLSIVSSDSPGGLTASTPAGAPPPMPTMPTAQAIPSYRYKLEGSYYVKESP
jgi:hypothetical protein